MPKSITRLLGGLAASTAAVAAPLVVSTGTAHAASGDWEPWRSAKAAETGPRTPETATTVACSSAPAPGALTVVPVCRTTIPARNRFGSPRVCWPRRARERGRRADSTCDAHLREGAVRAPGAHERSLPVGMPQPTLTADRRQGPPPSSSSWRVWCWSTVLRWLTLNRCCRGLDPESFGRESIRVPRPRPTWPRPGTPPAA